MKWNTVIFALMTTLNVVGDKWIDLQPKRIMSKGVLCMILAALFVQSLHAIPDVECPER